MKKEVERIGMSVWVRDLEFHTKANIVVYYRTEILIWDKDICKDWNGTDDCMNC